MKGVILAAGDGTRLASHTECRPKVLLQVGRQSIIDYTLDAFAQAGVTDVAIVIGHRGDLIEKWVGDGSARGLDIKYYFNPDYDLGNALSVYAARPFVGNDPFLLSMADHMVSPELLSNLLNSPDLTDTLAVDFRPSTHKVDEATRVWVSEDKLIRNIGKDLPEWNGLDTGVFLLSSSLFNAIEQIRLEPHGEYQLSRAIEYRMDRGHPLRACDVSGSFWQDVDTLEDLNLVRDLFSGGKNWEQVTKA